MSGTTTAELREASRKMRFPPIASTSSRDPRCSPRIRSSSTSPRPSAGGFTSWWKGGKNEDWVVEQEDPAQGLKTVHEAPNHPALRALLDEWHRPTQRWFARPVSELGRVFPYQPKDGPERRPTLHWILDHVQEHEIHHRAQLNLYLRLMGVTPPSV